LKQISFFDLAKLVKNFKNYSAGLYFLYRYISKLMLILQFWHIKNYYCLQYVQSRQSANKWITHSKIPT